MQKYILLLLTFLSVTSLFGQSQIDIKNYSIKDGLSQKNIQNMVQDDNGYLWMATWNGLERFDGYDFLNYKTYPESEIRIANHRYTKIIKSSLNNIWCITYDKRPYLFNTTTYQYEDPFKINNANISVERIYALKDGITWIITSEGNLYRIDENKLNEKEGIELYSANTYAEIGDIIYLIRNDRDGDEWVLTNKGTFILGKKNITNLMPFEFMLETDNDIYLATSKGLLACFNPSNNFAKTCISPFSISQVMGMRDLNNGKMALLQPQGIVIYDTRNEEFTPYEFSFSLERRTFLDSKNRLWLLGSNGEIAYIDSETEKITILNKRTIPREYILKSSPFVHEDKFGCIWVKPMNSSLYFYDEEAQQLELAFTYEMGGKKPVMYQMAGHYIDNQNNIWFIQEDGLSYLSFHRKSIDYITNRNKEEARSLIEDRQKRIWIGWRNSHKKQTGHLSLYNATGEWLGDIDINGKLTKEQTALLNADVYCIYEDKALNIWLGTKENGLFRLTPNADQSYKIKHFSVDRKNPYSLSSNSIYTILQDSSDRIWIGTYGGGINLLDQSAGDGERFIHANNSLSNYPNHVCDKVRSLYETVNGTIVIGTTGGLLTCNPNVTRYQSFQFYRHACNEQFSSLSNNDVYSIMQTPKGNILVTTLSGGINVSDAISNELDSLFFTHHNATNGAVPDFSLSSIEDGKGNIWVASENKLLRFDSDLNFIEEFTDDINITECKPILSSSGRLIFGSKYGALCVNIEDLNKSNYTPPVVFSHLDIYFKDTSRKQNIYNNEAQYLKSDERNFTISFVALDFVHTKDIKYAYRIKGLNDQWIEIGNHRSASLANIPPGDYLFQVKSTNGDGVWVENETSLALHVAPKFSETIWALLLIILFSLLFLLLVIYTVIRFTKLKKSVDFEKEMANMKLRFFTDISHELRTPLTLITSPIDEVLHQEKLSETGRGNMKVAKNNADRMLRLINQILDFRKIQNDKMKLFVEQTDVIPVIRKVYDNFNHLAQTKQINYKLSCELNTFVMYVDVDKLEKIIYNLLSNAFKYTSTSKSISLRISVNQTDLELEIEDEGRGINSHKLGQLFTRFETDDFNPTISTGIGLSLVKEYIGLMHGTVKVSSKPGEGSLFMLKIPGSYECYKNDSNVEFVLKDEIASVESSEMRIDETTNSDKEIRILIIEDNEELRSFIRSILSNDYTVYEAENGKQGLEMTNEILPDMVISDIMMPVMDGIEYLRQVKENNDTCHIPVVLLSAKASIEDQINGLKYGANEYITKPFSSMYLKAKIDSLIKQRQMLIERFGITHQLQTMEVSEKEEDVNPLPQLTEFDARFMERITQYTEDNIQNPDFKIDDLADAMNMSRTIFYRKVKSLTGVSPIDFVKKMRVNKAVLLLEQGEHNISEIGYLSGFASPQYFSRVFKEAMNCTPKEYKLKKNKN